MINTPNTLRGKAEARLDHVPATESLIHTNEKLLYELQVYQIELEMQNEELRSAHIALEESRDRYRDLYEFAPVGYLTLTRDGLIDEINLTATQLLGLERNKLLSRRFATLITPKDGDQWYLFFSNIMQRKNQRLNIELTLKGSNDTEFPAQLACVCINSMLRITLTDITKIKQTEAALHEAETLALISAERMRTAKVQEDALKRLQKITSLLPGMVFQFHSRIDGSSCFPYVSEAIRDIFRLSPEQVNEDASKLMSVIHPDDYDAVIATLQESAMALSPFSHEYRVKFDDGTVRWLLGNSMPERNADGSTLWHGFITDITERKFAEEKTRFQASLLNAVGQSVIATDTGGNITYMNRAAEKLYGWRSDEALGRSILDVTVPQLSHAQAEEIMTDLTQREGTWSGEFIVKHRDGTTFPVEVNDTSILDKDGKLIGVIGVSSDITERKQVDVKLLEINNLLSLSMQYSHMGSWKLNLIDHTSTRTLEHDRIFGYEVLQTQWNYEAFLDHVLPEDRFEVNDLFEKAPLAQQDWNIECRIRRADGETRWIFIAGGCYRDDQGALLSMLGIVRDITERKSLEQMLQDKNNDLNIAKTAAEEANLDKSIFLSRMSHELRTPLNAILGYAQLLAAGKPPLTDTQIGRLQPIIEAGWYLLELINEILDLAAIESGNLSLSPEPLSLLDVLFECQVLVQAQAEKYSVQLDFTQCDSFLTIYADRTRVKQILLNLLSNAIKYNREHGMVTVQCTQTAEHVYVCINDNGEGLSSEQLTQLFKPFNRLGQESGAKEGTGIGLVVTKQLIEQMGGSISVKSTGGVGSDFCVKLPSK